MGGYEEPPLFGPVDDAPVVVGWPPLPDSPGWARVQAGERERCDYCVRQVAIAPASVIWGPSWRRTGVDGAVLFLCERHAVLFADRDADET